MTHTPFTGTAEQRANLEKLIAYVAALPADYIGFDMDSFEADELCWTGACFGGHGPSAGIPKLAGEPWVVYCSRQFCLITLPEFDWLFSVLWVETDNTPQGAVGRARYLLFAGLPDDSREQMLGRAPLSYAVPA